MRNTNTSRTLAAVFALGLPLMGCFHHVNSSVSDADVAGLPPEDRAGIDAARQEVTQAQQAEVNAKNDISVAQRQVDVENQEVKRAKASLAIAETNVKSATEGAQTEEMLNAKGQRDHAKGDLDYHKAELDHANLEVDFSRAKLSEAQAWEYFAHAKVELEKARAYNKKMGDASPDAQTKLAKAEQQSADANLRHANSRRTTINARKKADKSKAYAQTEKAAIPVAPAAYVPTQPVQVSAPDTVTTPTPEPMPTEAPPAQ